MPRRIRTRHPEGRDAVAHAQHAGVAQHAAFHRAPVQCAGHDTEAPVPALRSLLEKRLIVVKEPAELSFGRVLQNSFVVHRPRRVEAVRAVRLHLMREIPAGNEDHAPVKRSRRLRDHLAEPVMVRQRQPRKPHAHEPVIRIRLIDEVQRNDRAVIKRRIPLPHRARGKMQPLRLLLQKSRERLVIRRVDPDASGPEASEIPRRAPSRRNMKVIRVHHTVR